MDNTHHEVLAHVYRTLLDTPPIASRTGTVVSKIGGDVSTVEVAVDLRDRSWTMMRGETLIGSSNDPRSDLIPPQVGLLMPSALPIWGRRRDTYDVVTVINASTTEVRVVAQHRKDPDLFAGVTLNLKAIAATAFTSTYELVRLQASSVVL